ncbi:MAG: hypothetical protein GWN00_00205, partial [Aliifodinibius sp.]|nr:hypothetical protein [Fodinibius sp.]NIY23288.1 hypothetical protein [Fodinibius sp.]
VEGCNPRFINDEVIPGTIPSGSIDGQLLIYLCGSPEEPNICLMTKDGDDPHTILDEVESLVDPKWSPVENLIAYVRTSFSTLEDNEPMISDIFIGSPDGTRVSQITNNPTMLYHSIGEIQWSPNGKQIAFSTVGVIGSEANDIYVINSDGTSLSRLSYPPASNFSPRWSPNTDQLAFLSRSSEGIVYLVIVTLNEGSNTQSRISLTIGGELSWSPDGELLVYTDRRIDLRGDYDLHIYNLASQKEYQLTSGEAVDFQPFWSKDSSRILFTSNLDGNFDLYSINVDGSNRVKQIENLTDAYIHNSFLSGDGKTIYFFLSGGKKDLYEMWAVDLQEFCE